MEDEMHGHCAGLRCAFLPLPQPSRSIHLGHFTANHIPDYKVAAPDGWHLAQDSAQVRASGSRPLLQAYIRRMASFGAVLF
jgi:hypothetical protein